MPYRGRPAQVQDLPSQVQGSHPSASGEAGIQRLAKTIPVRKGVVRPVHTDSPCMKHIERLPSSTSLRRNPIVRLPSTMKEAI